MCDWRKVLVVVVAVVAASAVFATPAPAEGTAAVHGVLSDNAVVKKPVLNASVTVGGVPATIDGQGYSIQGVPVGLQTVVVAAPRHSTATRIVTLLPGDNTLDVALDLTVRESYLRYYAAYNHRRFDPAWRMVHPDVRGTMLQWGKKLTYSRYVWYMKTWNLPFVSMRVKSVSSLATWRPEKRAGLPHARYTDLKRVIRVICYRLDGTVVDERCYNLWQEISGRWYIIFDAAFFAR
jgi:hypothetical protein